jgi:tRNA pseudouridine55 synthase
VFKPPEKEMRIIDIELSRCYKFGNVYILEAVLNVGSGAYIRSIAEEIGRRLGYPAMVKELRRTKIGKFDIADAKTLDAIHTT